MGYSCPFVPQTMVKPELVHEMEFTFWQNRFAKIGLSAFVVAGGCVVVVGMAVTVVAAVAAPPVV